MKKSELKKVNTIEGLESLGIGPVFAEIGYRGGGLGFSGRAVAEALRIDECYLPGKFGVYCNYLGGGIRGSVTGSGYNKNVPAKKAALLDELSEACKRAYLNAEGDMNDEEDEDGEVNWDAKATNASRKAGIISAY